MGMPLYGLKKDKEEKRKEGERGDEDKSTLEDFGEPADFRGPSRNGPFGDFGSSRSWRR